MFSPAETIKSNILQVVHLKKKRSYASDCISCTKGVNCVKDACVLLCCLHIFCYRPLLLQIK